MTTSFERGTITTTRTRLAAFADAVGTAVTTRLGTREGMLLAQIGLYAWVKWHDAEVPETLPRCDVWVRR